MNRIWAKGYVLGLYDHKKQVRMWDLPDNRRVELPANEVLLHSIAETPYYVGKIDDVIAAAFRVGAPIERL